MKLKYALAALVLAALSIFAPRYRAAEAGLTTCQTCSNVTPAQKVVLVHGRNDTSARWNTLVTNWAAKGYTEGTNLFRIDFTTYCGANGWCSNLASYPATYVNESYALCLQAYIESVIPAGEQVDLVAHSQGGIAARYYARFLNSRVTNDMVLMASPVNGTNNCTLAGSCTGINPETCGGSAFQHKLNGVSPEGDGSNDETPGGATPGPVHYSATGSSKDTVVVPSPCTSWFILDPQTRHAGNLSCSKNPNFTLDPDADSCSVSAQHLVIPTNTTAINDAYCKVNTD
jgi:triacylglycerol esterase/lipase EstA (alpha/beta hydrolase family)